MTIRLLEGSLQIDVFYECEDQDLEDNICFSMIECCPPAERLLCAGETNIYLTPSQAQELWDALIQAARRSEADRIT